MEVEEHDLLAEWNSKKRRRAFVTFERKMREYPSVASKAIGRTFDASDLECLEFIVEVGKSLRDAITHPSPFIDPRTGQTEKTFWMVGITLTLSSRLVKAVREYMVVVQGTLSDDVKQSAPWLFQQEAGNDTARSAMPKSTYGCLWASLELTLVDRPKNNRKRGSVLPGVPLFLGIAISSSGTLSSRNGGASPFCRHMAVGGHSTEASILTR